jgi:CO/xanthine dehydrogenase Mo-binding subunit
MDPLADEHGLAWREAVAACAKRGVHLAAHGWALAPETSWDPLTGQGAPYPAYTFSANVVELEVDLETGETRVLAVTSGHDCGRVMNAAAAEGVVAGGVAQGLGYALLEEHQFKDGRILNDQLSTYLVPTAPDVPPVRTVLVEHPYADGPFGAKGLADAPVTPVAPAVVSALAQAAGVRLRQIPATAERVWKALEEARAAKR